MLSNAHWKKVYSLFDPMKKLEGETLKFFVARDRSQLDRIATEFRFATSPLHTLLVGQRGTGKSSELRYLGQHLQSDFLTVIIDVDELTDLFNVNHVEVLYLIGTSIFAAARLAGHALSDSLLNELYLSIQSLVRTNTEDKKFELPVKEILASIAAEVAAVATGGLAGAIIVSAAKIFKDVKFNLGVSDQVVRKMEVKPQISEISRCLNRLVAKAEELADRPLFVVVDGLDRVDFEQGRQIFAESQVLDQPACHLVYVIPAHLYYSPYLNQAKQIFTKVYPLPNVKLHARDGSLWTPGYDIMRQVVDQRLASIGLKRDEVFAPDALDLLIEMSGGLMREFIRLAQNAELNAVQKKAARIERVHAQDAADALRRDYMAGVTPGLLDELFHVQEKGMPSGSEAGNLALQNHYILTQANRDIWYEVHPVIASAVNAEWVARK